MNHRRAHNSEEIKAGAGCMVLALQVEINVLAHEGLSLTASHCDSLMVVAVGEMDF